MARSGREEGERALNISGIVKALLAFAALLLTIPIIVQIVDLGTQTEETAASSAIAKVGQNDLFEINTITVMSTIFLIVGGLAILMFQQVFSQIRDAEQRFADLNAGVNERVKSLVEAETKEATDRTSRLFSELDAIEERYPWLSTLAELELVINVQNSAAVLETCTRLINRNQRDYAYEWLSGASTSKELAGTNEDFMTLAILSRVMFGDLVMALRFMVKISGSGLSDRRWSISRLLHFIDTRQLDEAAKIVFDVENRALGTWRESLRSLLSQRHRRFRYALSEEMLEAIEKYYQAANDFVGTERLLPQLKKRTLRRGASGAAERATARRGAAGETLSTPHSEFISLQLLFYRAENHLLRLLVDKDCDRIQFDAMRKRILAETGSRAIYDALGAAASEIAATHDSASWQKRTESGSPPSAAAEAATLAKLDESEPAGEVGIAGGSDSQFDPVWQEQWQPNKDPGASIGRSPERMAAETKARSVAGQTARAQRQARQRELEAVWTSASRKAILLDGQVAGTAAPPTPGLRALDIVPTAWVAMGAENGEVLEKLGEWLGMPIEAEARIEVAPLPWLDDRELIRLRSDRFAPGAIAYLIAKALDNPTILDGDSDSLAEVGDLMRAVEGDQAIDYLRFACFFMRPEANRVERHLVECADDFVLLALQDSKVKERITRNLKPARIVVGDDATIIQSCMLTPNSLSWCEIAVSRFGRIDIFDETPLLEELALDLRFPLATPRRRQRY